MKREKYFAPEVEMLAVHTEEGFAGSSYENKLGDGMYDWVWEEANPDDY